MNITFTISHLTLLVGSGIFLRNYVNKLSEKGHKITIISLKVDRNIYRFNEKIKIIDLKTQVPSSPLFWIKFIEIKRKFIRIINELKTDIIISIHFPLTYFSSAVCKKRGLKHVYFCLEPFRYFHDKEFYLKAPIIYKISSWFLRIIFKKLDIRSISMTDEIIYISKFIKERGKKIYNREGYVHYIGIETKNKKIKTDAFTLKQSLNISKDTHIIFTLGLSHQMKGAKELIIIFNKIIKEISNTILLIGGYIRKDNCIEILKLIKKLRIPKEKIKFIGYIDEPHLGYYYAKSSLTFYTAIDEAYGLIPLESMLNGTPVISFEGGPSETIIDGQTGYIVKKNDVNDFARKAIKLIKEKNLYNEFSKNASEHIRNNFNLDKSVLKLESLLRNIIFK